jgi:hypothetical protein
MVEPKKSAGHGIASGSAKQTGKRVPQQPGRHELARGAEAIKSLIADIGVVSDTSVGRHGCDVDGRDYRAIQSLVVASLAANLSDDVPEGHRQGYL